MKEAGKRQPKKPEIMGLSQNLGNFKEKTCEMAHGESLKSVINDGTSKGGMKCQH